MAKCTDSSHFEKDSNSNLHAHIAHIANYRRRICIEEGRERPSVMKNSFNSSLSLSGRVMNFVRTLTAHDIVAMNLLREVWSVKNVQNVALVISRRDSEGIGGRSFGMTESDSGDESETVLGEGEYDFGNRRIVFSTLEADWVNIFGWERKNC